MQRPLSLFLVLCLVVALVAFATSCRKDEDNPVKPGTNQPMVTTTIAGVIADENGNAMQGISVQAHGKTTTTNQNGFFVIKDARVPKDRCFVLARKNDYFTASRAEQPKAGGVTHMRLSMMSNAPQYSVNASTGGKVSLVGGGSVELPANGFVLADGQAYTGKVHVAARWLNPTSSSFYGFFPGDFTAQRTDNSQTELYSYGVLNVELTSDAGAKVQLASGKKATLTYPVPSKMQAGAPADMPLWYFDEELGMWKEDGKAVRQGTVYTGEVSHFTPWNVDVPVQTGVIRGRVLCDNETVSDIWVKIGQNEVRTDENGEYETRVPVGITLEISVEASKNLGSKTAAPVQVGPVTAEQTITQDLVISPCPAYLTGTLVDCNDKPTEGVVEVSGTVGYGYTLTNNGQFRVRVEPKVNLTVNAIGYNGAEGEPTVVQQVPSGTTHNVGAVELCPQNAVPFTDISLLELYYAYCITFSPDGSLLVVGGTPNSKIYDVASGTLLQTLDSAARAEFSKDGSKLMMRTLLDNGYKIQVFNTSTWQKIQDFPRMHDAVFFPDGNAILALTESSSGTIAVKYSVATGAEIERYAASNIRNNYLTGITASATQFVYSTYTSTDDYKAVVWNMGTNTLAWEIAFPSGGYTYSLRLSSDGSLLIVGLSQSIHLYDVATGQKTHTISPPNDYTTFALSPNNTHYVLQKQPQPAALYDVATNSLIRLLPSPVQKRFTTFVYNSNETRLVGIWHADQGLQARIWHLQ